MKIQWSMVILLIVLSIAIGSLLYWAFMYDKNCLREFADDYCEFNNMIESRWIDQFGYNFKCENDRSDEIFRFTPEEKESCEK